MFVKFKVLNSLQKTVKFDIFENLQIHQLLTIKVKEIEFQILIRFTQKEASLMRLITSLAAQTS